jgi:flavin reductase
MNNALRELFRQSMRRFATSVSVISCASEGVRYGITATAVTSLCAEPASVLVCINSGTSVAPPLLRQGEFCLNLLKRHHVDVSRMFGGKAKGEERFRYGTWKLGENGVPYLVDAQANLFCKVDGVMAYGTHMIVIGKVESGQFAPEINPLLYQDGDYASVVRLHAQSGSLGHFPAQHALLELPAFSA